MELTSRAELHHQLATIITGHMEALQPYIITANTSSALDIHIPDEVIYNLERLMMICEHPVELTRIDLYIEAEHRLEDVHTFLNTMNVYQDRHFERTSIGKVVARARRWCQTVRTSHFSTPISHVWQVLEPAIPDCLQEVENGVYVAKWWKPVPMMDIEILLRTDGVMVHSTPYEPHRLPGGLAVRFSLAAALLEVS